MKKINKILTLFVLLIVSITIFSSCNPYKEVKKVSKGLTTYSINANLDVETMTVSAKERVKVVNKTKTILDKLNFNLYGRAFREESLIKPWTTLNEGKCFPNGVNYGDMQVNKVKVNNQEKEVKYVGEDSNALEVGLACGLEPKDSIDVEIDFSLKLAECTHRLGFFQGSINLGNWFPILAMYEKGEFVIDPYYSTGDPFYSDIANFNIELTYPKDYTLASTGIKSIKDNNKNTNKANLKANAVRDFAIFLTNKGKIETEKYKNTTIRYVGYEEDDNLNYNLSVAKKALKYFSETFGAYPYETLDVVKAPFVHGGMEYPSVVIIADNIKEGFDFAKVIVHEIAHQWWYGVVGNNEIKEAWIDESLAEFSTVLFFKNHTEFDVSYEELVSEAFASYTLFADIVSSLNKKINTSMLLSVNDYVSEYEYSYMIYVRGILMFDSIMQVVKEENLIKALKKYYETYKFKIATTDDLVMTIKKCTKKDVDGVMDSWLTGKTVIGNL